MAATSAAGALVVAGLTLVGWAIGSTWLTAWRLDGLPMAPSTALLALFLAGALLAPTLRWQVRLASVGGLGALILGSDRVRGVYSAVEHLGFVAEGTVGSAPVGFISPLTAGAFVTTAAAVVLLAAADRRRVSRFVPATLGVLLVVTGGIVVLLEAFGLPLLAHDSFIPPALNTGVLLAALGVSVGARAVATQSSPAGAQREGRAVFLAIGFALIGGVVAGAYAYYRHDEQQIRTQTELELDAISRLQVQQVHRWRRERLADGEVLRRNQTLTALVTRHLADRESAVVRDALTQWFDAYEAYRDYDAGWILASDGSTAIPLLGIGRMPSAALVAAAQPLIKRSDVNLGEFYPSAADARPRLALVVPLTGAAIVLRIDPAQFLLPVVETWPNASTTGETLLVRRDGSEVLVLSGPRFGQTAPMPDGIAPAEGPSINSYVTSGITGIVEGLDYHGARAIAVVRPVADSGWTLITHVDIAELEGMLWRRLGQVVLFAGLLLFALGTGLAVVWQRQRLSLVLARNAQESRAARLAQLYAAQSACSNAIIRCATTSELCERVCEIAVTEGGLAMAWVGMVDDATGVVAPVASYGQGLSYVAGLQISAQADTAHGQGPTGLAVRDGHPVWSDRFGVDPVTRTWRESGEAYGWTSSGALPLRRNGRVVGALSVYSASESRFDDDSRRLLTEMAANVSYAFDAFDRDTRRREAEARLAESAEYYEKLFTEGRLARLLVEPITGQIVEANLAAVALYGWDLATLTSMRVSEINTAEAQTVADALSRARIGEATRFEFQHRTASGRLIDVEVWSSSVTVRGRSLLLSTILDVTEQRRLEAQFLQAQKMEVVGRLASGVAHDFNNLLTVINGTAGIAIEDLPPGSPLRADLDAILDAGARAAQLTSQLLTFSRSRQWMPATVDVGVQVSRAADMVRRLLGADVRLKVEVNDGLWAVVIDPGQLDQVVLNLSVNARDAMPAGGVLTVAVRNGDVTADHPAARAGATPGPHVCLVVQDTGTGMPEDVRARLFEPFFTTKEVGRGTGLGLTTVFGIVKHAGGAVTVDTELGRGTTFTVWLPATSSM